MTLLMLGEKFGKSHAISFKSRDHDFKFSSDTFDGTPLKFNVS